ncbi:hypothetical protein PAT3040_07270 [Paenibacillus agaridevorans]|uniref:Uncharacterized protein n=1 Tax=Paenibacillus agaridevorans TaxID=171404 RepID=A0A2R5F1N3_9BACL|nr:hypothetical protein PAT3040_07270 [Paenibacillus agaridevorans]
MKMAELQIRQSSGSGVGWQIKERKKLRLLLNVGGLSPGSLIPDGPAKWTKAAMKTPAAY